MEKHETNIDLQMDALNTVAQPGIHTAMQHVEALYQEIPKQQVDFQLKNLYKSIHLQRRQFAAINMAKLTFRDLLEVKIAADFFAGLFPEPLRAKLGIVELLLNAVEHGNLGITAKEKNGLLASGEWMSEIIRRLSLPEYQDKYVHAYCLRHPKYVQITIRDDGDGFDTAHYIESQEITPHDILNGRGIAMAKHVSFDEMEYHGKGNIVCALQYVKE